MDSGAVEPERLLAEGLDETRAVGEGTEAFDGVENGEAREGEGVAGMEEVEGAEGEGLRDELGGDVDIGAAGGGGAGGEFDGGGDGEAGDAEVPIGAGEIEGEGGEAESVLKDGAVGRFGEAGEGGVVLSEIPDGGHGQAAPCGGNSKMGLKARPARWPRIWRPLQTSQAWAARVPGAVRTPNRMWEGMARRASIQWAARAWGRQTAQGMGKLAMRETAWQMWGMIGGSLAGVVVRGTRRRRSQGNGRRAVAARARSVMTSASPRRKRGVRAGVLGWGRTLHS